MNNSIYLGAMMPVIQEKLIIDGQEMKPIDEKDMQIEWFNYNAYKEVTLTFGCESFDVMVLKTDIDRLEKQFKKAETESEGE